MRAFIFLVGFMPLIVMGQIKDKRFAGFDPKTDLISEKYDAGPHLIYDCEDGHWVCVMPEFYEQCQLKRDEDQLANKVHTRCAPIGEFPTKRSCFQRQLYLTSNNYAPNFCVLGRWKQKEMEF